MSQSHHLIPTTDDFESFRKSEGIFLNLDMTHPYAIDVGKRVTKQFNIGGRLMYYSDEDTWVFAPVPYIQYYFGKDVYEHDLYVELYGGIGFRTTTSEAFDYTRNPLCGGMALGFQLVGKENFKHYFEMGFVATRKEITECLNDPLGTKIRDISMGVRPYITLLGLQF